jgi:hypothetical protein
MVDVPCHRRSRFCRPSDSPDAVLRWFHTRTTFSSTVFCCEYKAGPSSLLRKPMASSFISATIRGSNIPRHFVDLFWIYHKSTILGDEQLTAFPTEQASLRAIHEHWLRPLTSIRCNTTGPCDHRQQISMPM